MSRVPRVSVIVPVYGVERYLEQCLRSLASQTLEDIEVVVVNDSSPDGSQAIIDRFVAERPSMFRALLKPNGGLGDARNFGVRHAHGEFIAFVDSDDYVAHDMMERLYEAAIASRADMVVCPIAYVRTGGVDRRYFDDTGVFGTGVRESPAVLLAAGSYAWNKLYRRSLWTEGRFEFPVRRWYEDSAVIYNVMLAAHRIVAVNEPLYHYRANRDGAISTACDDRIFDVFLSCRDLIDHFAADAAYPVLRPTVAQLCVKHVFARIGTLLGGGERPLARRFVKVAFDFLDDEFPDWRDARLAKARPFFRRTPLHAFFMIPLRVRRWFRGAWRAALRR